MEITDEMVERAAYAIEKQRKKGYEWTDAQFDIWFHRDKDFVERIKGWSSFRGTEKAKLLHETRLGLEAALRDSP